MKLIQLSQSHRSGVSAERANHSMKSKWRRSADAPLRFVAVTLTRTPATSQRHAVGAEKFPGNFQRVKTAAAFADSIFS